MQLNVQRDSSLPTIRRDSDITNKLSVFMTHLHVPHMAKEMERFAVFLCLIIYWIYEKDPAIFLFIE